MLKIFKVFFEWVFEVKFAICLGNLKFFLKKNVKVVGVPLVGRHVD